jgi:MFS family permease
MKRIISIVGLFLAAVFVFSAGIASSASAAPGLLLAREAGGGSIAGVTFLSSAGLAQLFTHGGGAGSEIDCKDATNHGLFLSPTLGNVLIRFLGCSSEGQPCHSLNAGKEEIHLPLTTLFHLGLAHLTLTVGRIPAILILVGLVHIICSEIFPTLILVLGSVIGALRLDEPNNHGPIPLEKPFLTALLSFEQTEPNSSGLQHLRLFLFEDELHTYDLDATVGGGEAKLASEVAKALFDLFRLPNGNHIDIELFENK